MICKKKMNAQVKHIRTQNGRFIYTLWIKKTRICMLGWKKDACFATVMISKYKEMVALVPVAVWR